MFLQKLKDLFTKPIYTFNCRYSPLRPWGWNWKAINVALTTSVLTAGLIFIIVLISITVSDKGEADSNIVDSNNSYSENNTDSAQPEEPKCNVLGINLHGFLTTYVPPTSLNESGYKAEDQTASEEVVMAIDRAKKDENTKAIILEVDSAGGYGVPAEEVATALKRAGKLTVAWIRGTGASAAYWASTGADRIFASAVSDVGSIGVTFSYVDNSKVNQKTGLTFNSLSTGPFKDMGNPDKPLTAAEKALIMRDLNIFNENFIRAVAANRKLDINKVRQLADGSSMPGELALKNGLIDQIGGIYEVKDYLKNKIGEEVELCW
ncbi:MAG: signal peptide peptidase SppA [Candidatus Buchananbacteria bacterium]